MNANSFLSKLYHVDTSYGRIAYREQGSGPVAVFLHAFPLNSYQWRDVIPGLADQFRCIAIDLMGMGHGQIKEGRSLSLSDQAQMVGEVIDTLGLGDVHLVGNDSGGGVAQILSTQRKNSILSLCLIDSEVHDNFPPTGLEPTISAAKNNQLGEMYNALANNIDLARQSMGAAIYHRPEDILTQEVLTAYMQPIIESLSSIWAFTQYVCDIDPVQLTSIEDELRQLNIPTLVLWGEKDQVFSIKWAEWLCETLPNAQMHVIEDGSLCWPEEQPKVLINYLRNFWL